ncbi:unnamed protein product [Vitrella brassicaformis CCMP3155]|uniref:Helicase ATP-binding domain-containing protein n=2 Tax=Vitrella brassicaformis TaxID=1169539 RepID=A0A0G4FW00_VITBC|nr:unnamed protein product [Vitrella brassicaformis CCMP3155]|eukprot:CEM19277.1 unnamed protein product [Vitrella brassicaformis CCMP3155]
MDDLPRSLFKRAHTGQRESNPAASKKLKNEYQLPSAPSVKKEHESDNDKAKEPSSAPAPVLIEENGVTNPEPSPKDTEDQEADGDGDARSEPAAAAAAAGGGGGGMVKDEPMKCDDDDESEEDILPRRKGTKSKLRRLRGFLDDEDEQEEDRAREAAFAKKPKTTVEDVEMEDAHADNNKRTPKDDGEQDNDSEATEPGEPEKGKKEKEKEKAKKEKAKKEKGKGMGKKVGKGGKGGGGRAVGGGREGDGDGGESSGEEVDIDSSDDDGDSGWEEEEQPEDDVDEPGARPFGGIGSQKAGGGGNGAGDDGDDVEEIGPEQFRRVTRQHAKDNNIKIPIGHFHGGHKEGRGRLKRPGDLEAVDAMAKAQERIEIDLDDIIEDDDDKPPPARQLKRRDSIFSDAGGKYRVKKPRASALPDPLARLPKNWREAIADPIFPYKLQQQWEAQQPKKEEGGGSSSAAAAAAAAASSASAGGGGGDEDAEMDGVGELMNGGDEFKSCASAKDVEDSTGDNDDEVMKMVSTSSLIGFGRPHPAMSATLNAVKLPPLLKSQELYIPKWVIDHGLLSSTQLESFICACRRGDKMLPGNYRGGFCLGDGTGSGKGRQLAAIIGHVNNKGAKRHIWFSISPDLRMDTQRDLKDLRIGIRDANLQGFQYGSFSKNKTNRNKLEKQLGPSLDGVVFLTYSMLGGHVPNTKCKGITDKMKEGDESVLLNTDWTRFGQLFEWFGGKDGQGAIIFDESHKAKNIMPELKGKARGRGGGGGQFQFDAPQRGKSNASLCGILVAKLQEVCPKAHVICASATAASELQNLGYMSRLGLWGKGTPYKTFGELYTKIGHNEESGMECLTINMKSQGLFSSRTISYKGAVFSVDTIDHNSEATRLYQKAVDFWQEMYAFLDDVLHDENVHWCGKLKEGEDPALSPCKACREWRLPPNKAKRPAEDTWAMQYFWGSVQRFFRVLLICIKHEYVVDKAVSSAPWSTGEARQKEMAEAQAEFGNELGVGSLEDDLEDEGEDDDGTGGTGKKLQSSGLQLIPLKVADKVLKTKGHRGEDLPQYVQRKEDLLKKIARCHLPSNPIDRLIDEFGGPRKVAELTGRKKRWERNPITGQMEYIDRGCYRMEKANAKGKKDFESMNNSERLAFQEGRKKVAIITEAASAGISLHCDKSLEQLNSRPRVMFTLELPWSADKAVQQFGRIHRSNQLKCPEFHLVVTEMGGEIRFTSTISRRMKLLGALTRGDRRASMGEAQEATLGEFDVQSKLGAAALENLMALIKNAASNADHCDGLDDFIVKDDGKEKQKSTKGSMTDEDEDDDHDDEGEGDDDKREQRQQQQEGDKASKNHFSWQDHFDSFHEFALVAYDELVAVGFSPEQFDDDGGTKRVSKQGGQKLKSFMNRLLMMRPAIQNSLFEWFMYILADKEAEAKQSQREGTGEGIMDLNKAFRGLSTARQTVTFDQHEIIATDPETNAATWYTKVIVNRGIAWEDAKKLYLSVRDATDKNMRGAQRKLPILVVQKRETFASEKTYMFYQANLGAREQFSGSFGKLGVVTYKNIVNMRRNRDIDKIPIKRKVIHGDLVEDFSEIAPHWTSWYEMADKKCSHIQYFPRHNHQLDKDGNHVTRDGICTHGMRKFDTHIISGNIINSFGYLDKEFQTDVNDEPDPNDTSAAAGAKPLNASAYAARMKEAKLAQQQAAQQQQQQQDGDDPQKPPKKARGGGGRGAFFKTIGGRLQISRATESVTQPGEAGPRSVVGIQIDGDSAKDTCTMVHIIESNSIFNHDEDDDEREANEDSDDEGEGFQATADVKKKVKIAKVFRDLLKEEPNATLKECTSEIQCISHLIAEGAMRPTHTSLSRTRETISVMQEKGIIEIDPTKGTRLIKRDANLQEIFHTGIKANKAQAAAAAQERVDAYRVASTLVKHLKSLSGLMDTQMTSHAQVFATLSPKVVSPTPIAAHTYIGAVDTLAAQSIIAGPSPSGVRLLIPASSEYIAKLWNVTLKKPAAKQQAPKAPAAHKAQSGLFGAAMRSKYE